MDETTVKPTRESDAFALKLMLGLSRHALEDGDADYMRGLLEAVLADEYDD